MGRYYEASSVGVRGVQQQQQNLLAVGWPPVQVFTRLFGFPAFVCATVGLAALPVHQQRSYVRRGDVSKQNATKVGPTQRRNVTNGNMEALNDQAGAPGESVMALTLVTRRCDLVCGQMQQNSDLHEGPIFVAFGVINRRDLRRRMQQNSAKCNKYWTFVEVQYLLHSTS